MIDPFFLDTPGGRIFAIHRCPPEPVGQVLVVPAFNEELNRCRTMVTKLGQTLAGDGFGTLAIDLFGTGDSDGEHGDARWEAWLANIDEAVRWLDTQGGCTAVLGIRNGALLAAEWLHGAPPLTDRSLIFWQPIIDGKQYFTQFLRMRIAAAMDRTDRPKETTAGMRAQLAEGAPLEIVGYEIHPELAQAIDDRNLAAFAPPAGTRVLWLEQLTPAVSVPSPVSERAITRWQELGVEPEVQGYEGEAFWQLHQRAFAPDAIEITRDWLIGRPLRQPQQEIDGAAA